MMDSFNGSEFSAKRTGRAEEYSVRSVCRACDILASFRRPEEVLHLREVTRRTGLHKATTLRLLSTLASKGLFERVGASSYRPLFQPLHIRNYRIGYATQSNVKTFISTVNDGIIRAARDAGVELLVLNNKASRVIAIRNAERFIEEKVNLVVEFQLHMGIASTLSVKYANAGIPVITIDAPQPGALYYGPDNYKVGYSAGIHLGRWAATHWNGQVEQVVLVAPSNGFLRARMLGIQDGLRAILPLFDKAAVVKYERRPNFENTLSVVRRHLRQNSGRHILMGAVNDQSALGALQAFRETGKEQYCAISGQGGAIEARQELRRPNTRFICSVAYFPECYGAKIVRLAIDIMEKQAVPRVALVQHQILNAQNVDKYYPNDGKALPA